MNEKDAILGRVREALQQETDSHVRQRSLVDGPSLPVLDPPGAQQRTEFLPPVGETFDERVALFREISEKLKTEFHLVDSKDSARQLIADHVRTGSWRKLGCHDHPLVNEVLEGLEIERFPTDREYDARELEQCEAGISGCEALIAQTASVLITNRSSGGRALSVLPPHHIVLARSDQMLATLVEGYQLLRQRYGPSDWPSFLSVISGPSRTADVERVLVLGAHGPKRLTIILIT